MCEPERSKVSRQSVKDPPKLTGLRRRRHRRRIHSAFSTKGPDAKKAPPREVKKVIISAPADGPDATLSSRERQDLRSAKHHVISNASPTHQLPPPVAK